MLSKNRINSIISLQNKKQRDLQRIFIAEGSKLVFDLLKSRFTIRELFIIPEKTGDIRSVIYSSRAGITEVTEAEMTRITSLTSPSPILAIVEMAESAPLPSPGPEDLILALDDIRDPGNMGTIVRIADWFGISAVICSETCVDLYNPKVVQSSMGSIARVTVYHTNLPDFLAGVPDGTTIYGAFMEGENMYQAELKQSGIIIIGNEARGISPEVAAQVTDKISIPAAPIIASDRAESLNASVATAIICAEFRRRTIPGRNIS
ncbi:MAG TPA: RNA methyltransferase [Bacteroidales bacterium]|nr:RNA methyltransferase [Bacteroidales bacterium]